MDGITQFLFEDEDPLPILTGYFLKIMEQLLDKQKQSTLEYLLIHQEGRIFNGLLQHLDHHSLATLLIKLIEQQIQPIKKEKWSVDYEIDSDFESQENELSPEQLKMQQVLKEKSVMVVTKLVDMLSPKNADEIHMTLNAQNVLNEFCDNESFFQILIEPRILQRIVSAVSSTDANAQNQQYALNFLTQIITQFIEQENSFFKDKKEEALERISTHFTDLCYNCMMILRGGDSSLNQVSQSGRQVRRTGMLRIRAIEQLRAIFTLLQKRGTDVMREVMSDAMRKKVIETMFYMMRNYQQCSISHQQGLLVLNLIRENFDEEDLESMKNFVRVELEKDCNFYYPSGKTTSRLNLGQIIKIAIELRLFTQKQLDEMDSSEEEDLDQQQDAKGGQDSIEKRSKMQDWFKFCEQKIAKIEKIWNRKLENPQGQAAPIADEEDEETKEANEQKVQKLVEIIDFSGKRSRGMSEGLAFRRADSLVGYLEQANQAKQSKDDVFDKQQKIDEFGDNQFWKAPEQYDIDDLLAEMQ